MRARLSFIVLPALLVIAQNGAADPNSDRASASVAKQRPNVVLYVIDTLRADGLGPYGNPVVRTPVADSLAREGTLFENANAVSAWTRASIASILSGLYPDAHGAETRRDVLPGQVVLLSEIFAAHGYATAGVVANPNIGSFYGFKQGFGTYIELYRRRKRGTVRSKESIVPSEQVVRNAVDWLARTERPFFLFVLAIDPHWPYSPPAEYDRYRGDYKGRVDTDERAVTRPDLALSDRERIRHLYFGEIDYADEYLGKLIGALKARGEYDDTVVVLTSDHGESFWENGQVLHGSNLYQEAVQVPLIIRYPKAMPPGARVEQPVELVDITPTLLDLAGMSIPPGLDGRSLMRLTEGEERALYATLDLAPNYLKSITRHPWKLIRDVKRGTNALYNLELENAESSNLIDQYPKRAAALALELDARIAANEKLRAALARHESVEKLDSSDLPDEAREALEALGYLHPASE